MSKETMGRIDPTWTISELLASCPESASVLRSLGIDACCGGCQTITVAARRAGIDPKALIRSLEIPISAVSSSLKPSA